MENTTVRRVSGSTGMTVNAHAPTRGSRHGIARWPSISRTSRATRGPTGTKYELISSGLTEGSTALGLLPVTIGRILRYTELGPCSLIRARILSRLSRRIAAFTPRLAVRYRSVQIGSIGIRVRCNDVTQFESDMKAFGCDSISTHFTVIGSENYFLFDNPDEPKNCHIWPQGQILIRIINSLAVSWSNSQRHTCIGNLLYKAGNIKIYLAWIFTFNSSTINRGIKGLEAHAVY